MLVKVPIYYQTIASVLSVRRYQFIIRLHVASVLVKVPIYYQTIASVLSVRRYQFIIRLLPVC